LRGGPEELFLWEYLKEIQQAVIPVLTKADKLKQGERSRQAKHMADTLTHFGMAAHELIWFSAITHEGRERLWSRLLECLGGG
jgi:GTP-binding protein EngB required for normal cell division